MADVATPRIYSQRELLARLTALALKHWPGCLLLMTQQAALVLLSFFSLGLGLILNSINLRLLELEQLITKR